MNIRTQLKGINFVILETQHIKSTEEIFEKYERETFNGYFRKEDLVSDKISKYLKESTRKKHNDF